MTVLPDVNLLLSFGWATHNLHGDTRRWFKDVEKFVTCPITELGFIRVSMSPAFRCDYRAAAMILDALTGLPNAGFLPADVPSLEMPVVGRYKDTTAAYLVALAQSHGYQLATLDEGLLSAEWSRGVAVHPFRAT